MHFFFPHLAMLKSKSGSVCSVSSIFWGVSSIYYVWCQSSMFLALLKYLVIPGWMLTFHLRCLARSEYRYRMVPDAKKRR